MDILPATTRFPGLPDGWLMLWCNGCGYSIVFDESTVDSYGPERWERVLDEAIEHDHATTGEVPIRFTVPLNGH